MDFTLKPVSSLLRPSQVGGAVLGSQREETLQPSESRNNNKRHSGIYNKTTEA